MKNLHIFILIVGLLCWAACDNSDGLGSQPNDEKTGAEKEEVEGTAECPYLIFTADDLREVSLKVNDDTDYAYAHYRLMADIDLQEVEFVPIGFDDFYHRFFGSFDGNGFTVSGLRVTEERADNGLFGVIGTGGKVFNLAVTGTVTGGSTAGGIAGGNFGTIENCYVNVTVSGKNHAGGIVGHNRTLGKVIRCYSTGSVAGTSTAIGAGNAGGIAGYNSASVSRCVSLVSTVDGVTSAGRVIGTNKQASSANKALDNILVNGNIIGDDGDAQTHGTDVSYGALLSVVFNTWDTSIWNIPEGNLTRDGQLPTLK